MVIRVVQQLRVNFEIDSDIVNAALNILGEGLRLIAAVGIPEVLNACGELASSGVIQADTAETGITRLEVV